MKVFTKKYKKNLRGRQPLAEARKFLEEQPFTSGKVFIFLDQPEVSDLVIKDKYSKPLRVCTDKEWTEFYYKHLIK